MASNDFLKRYLDLGMALAAPTQARAEALVKELVKAGEVQSDQAREIVAVVIERGRLNGEKLIETVRAEVKHQITAMGLASQSDIERVEQRLSSLFGGPGAPAPPAPPAQTTPAEKTPAKKTSAKKTSAKKTPAKKTPAKKTPAKKTPAKKTPAKKTPAKKKPMAPVMAPTINDPAPAAPEVLSS